MPDSGASFTLGGASRMLRLVTTGLALAIATVALCAPAQAAQVVALSGADGTGGGGGCSLREAINATNADNTAGTDCILVGTPGADEILLVTGPQSFDITFAG